MEKEFMYPWIKCTDADNTSLAPHFKKKKMADNKE